MTEHIEGINQLADKLDSMLKRQEALAKELDQLREEIKVLKVSEIKEVKKGPEVMPEKPLTVIAEEPVKQAASTPTESAKIKADLEKYIGENLINKIGIAITVIGVAIGTKYAIDHELISPVTRIILGYLFGSGLLFFAIRLKMKYNNFSAVLLSGAMAIMYFITYAAFSFYNLFPQMVSFIIMVIITAFTVNSAINYNRQVIAHIGLVGAYAVPFLLSPESGNAAVLFSYMAIINIGILIISFRKYWKPLFYSSFLLTWLMYLTWFGSNFKAAENVSTASVFLSVFFITFYLMFLAYKLLQKEKFDFFDILLLLANSFIFYGIGYHILTKLNSGNHYLGLFTLCNAIIHSFPSLFIYRQKLADRNLFYFVSGLALIFLTIAIPVQLDGNWVTLLWAGEASLLFWIGRTRGVRFYEILSYIMIYLSFFSIIGEWAPANNVFDNQHPVAIITPLLNINFLTSVLFTSSIGFICWLDRNSKYSSPLDFWNEIVKGVSFTLVVILLLGLYFSFSIEITKYWNQLYAASLKEIKKDGLSAPFRYWDHDLAKYKTIWLINYSLLYLSVISIIIIQRVKETLWGVINIACNTLGILVFLIAGLYILSELRESYLNQTLSEYYNRGIFNIWIRYISYAFVALLLVSTYKYINQDFLKSMGFNFKIAFDILLYTSLIWIISSELLSWMDIMHSDSSYKLALSILWGVYSLIMIGLGIWKKKRHLRIAAIILFTITLIKLFLYDISHLDTISKTIVFVTLGVLLLIISFLYNKYKTIISGDL